MSPKHKNSIKCSSADVYHDSLPVVQYLEKQACLFIFMNTVYSWLYGRKVQRIKCHINVIWTTVTETHRHCMSIASPIKTTTSSSSTTTTMIQARTLNTEIYLNSTNLATEDMSICQYKYVCMFLDYQGERKEDHLV